MQPFPGVSYYRRQKDNMEYSKTIFKILGLLLLMLSLLS